MQPVGLVNTKVSTGYAQKFPRTLDSTDTAHLLILFNCSLSLSLSQLGSVIGEILGYHNRLRS